MTPIFKPAFTPDAYHKFYSIFDHYNKELVAIAKSLINDEPDLLLDLACGTGLSASALRANFDNAAILGVDIAADLVDFAQTSTIDPKIEFRRAEIAEILDDIAPGSIDLIFVKSAYHYFDDQIPFSRLKKVLSDYGVIVVAERTARSAQSYPLPNIASHHWTNFFSQSQVDRRFAGARSASMKLSVSCYGEFVKIPTFDYLTAVSANQLFGVSALKPDLVMQWINNQLTPESATVTVFEEFWLYLLRN
ncbi:methyltransferase domain-containing protein [Chloroflexi bacterium TSY]|nr:methyltransferase domain-containing protein [Chloroflexi bacterium TSY]